MIQTQLQLKRSGAPERPKKRNARHLGAYIPQ